MKKEEKNFIRIFLGVCLALIISFLKSVFDLAWGIAGFFVLIGFISYFEVDASNILVFLEFATFIMENWGFFFMALMIYHIQDKLKDLGVI